MAFESLWFHSQYQMRNGNFRGRSKSSNFARQVGRGTQWMPEICVQKLYWSLLLGTAPVEEREGQGIRQKLCGGPSLLSGIETTGLGVCIPAKRIPRHGK